MKIESYKNKRYEKYSVLDNPDIFERYAGEYLCSVNFLQKLAKDLGFSYDLYETLSKINIDTAKDLVKSMSSRSKITEIILLLDEESKEVIDYSLESRFPVLNDDFVYRVSKLAETSPEITLSEVYHSKEDTISSIILKRKDPITIEEKYENSDSVFVDYQIGILLVNDELNSSYSRLVLYIEGQPLYLPASYYNPTTSRYKKSTGSTVEALEVLVLKAIDDLRDDALLSKMQDLHYKYRANKNILSSYEEYNAVLRTMRKIPTIIDDNSFLEDLLAKYENFEKKYTHLEDKKSSYVFRCTALSDITVGALVAITSTILSELGAPAAEYFNIRELLGSYVSTDRIAEDIAQIDTH